MKTDDRFVSGVTSEPLAASAPAGDAVAWPKEEIEPGRFVDVDPDICGYRMPEEVAIDPAADSKRPSGGASAPAVEVREALDAIDVQIHEMRSLKGWRLNLIRENLTKLRTALSASPREMVVQKGLNSEGEHQTEHTAPKLSFPPPYLQFSEPLWKQHEYCIQRLMNQIGYPNSQSIFEAMKQLLNDADHIERQRALLTEPSPSSRLETAWQPIETAPKDGHDILLYATGLRRLGFWDEARGGVWSEWPGRAQIFPTHWQPLPSPPSPDCSGCKPGGVQKEAHATKQSLSGADAPRTETAGGAA